MYTQGDRAKKRFNMKKYAGYYHPDNWPGDTYPYLDKREDSVMEDLDYVDETEEIENPPRIEPEVVLNKAYYKYQADYKKKPKSANAYASPLVNDGEGQELKQEDYDESEIKTFEQSYNVRDKLGDINPNFDYAARPAELTYDNKSFSGMGFFNDLAMSLAKTIRPTAISTDLETTAKFIKYGAVAVGILVLIKWLGKK